MMLARTLSDWIVGGGPAPASSLIDHLGDLAIGPAPLADRSAVLCGAGGDMGAVAVTPAFEALTGYPADAVIGRNLRFLQGAETAAEARALFAHLIGHAKAGTVEILNYAADGRPFWHQIMLRPLLGPDGAPTHFLAVQSA